jgi:hypothetical protein
MLRIYWAIAEADPTANPKNLSENIAYNTLQYNFARMLLLPQIAISGRAPAEASQLASHARTLQRTGENPREGQPAKPFA